MRVWSVKAALGAVTELGDHLRCEGIQVVTLESTSEYRRIWYVALEAAGLRVQLVNARAVKNVPGRAKTDKKDAVWLAKLTERALIKVSAVASALDTQSVRAKLEALIAGQRNPRALADLAIGWMRAKRKELTEALDGRFEDHHAELARILLDQIDALTSQIDTLEKRISELIAQIPAAQGVDGDGTTGPDAATRAMTRLALTARRRG
jgi:transposase